MCDWNIGICRTFEWNVTFHDRFLFTRNPSHGSKKTGVFVEDGGSRFIGKSLKMFLFLRNTDVYVPLNKTSGRQRSTASLLVPRGNICLKRKRRNGTGSWSKFVFYCVTNSFISEIFRFVCFLLPFRWTTMDLFTAFWICSFIEFHVYGTYGAKENIHIIQLHAWYLIASEIKHYFNQSLHFASIVRCKKYVPLKTVDNLVTMRLSVLFPSILIK